MTLLQKQVSERFAVLPCRREAHRRNFRLLETVGEEGVLVRRNESYPIRTHKQFHRMRPCDGGRLSGNEAFRRDPATIVGHLVLQLRPEPTHLGQIREDLMSNAWSNEISLLHRRFVAEGQLCSFRACFLNLILQKAEESCKSRMVDGLCTILRKCCVGGVSVARLHQLLLQRRI